MILTRKGRSRDASREGDGAAAVPPRGRGRRRAVAAVAAAACACALGLAGAAALSARPGRCASGEGVGDIVASRLDGEHASAPARGLVQRAGALVGADDGMAGLTDSYHRMRVRYTFVDEALTHPGETIDEMWEEHPDGSAVISQTDAVVPLLDGASDDCYVALVKPGWGNGMTGEVGHADFGYDNDYAQALPGVAYDEAQGIAYVPKSDFVDGGGNEVQVPVRCQVMVRQPLGQEPAANVACTIQQRKAGVTGPSERTVAAASWLADLTVNVVDASCADRVGSSDVHVFLNGSSTEAPRDGWSYDPATGDLTVLANPVGVACMTVRVGDDPVQGAAAAALGLLGATRAEAWESYDGTIVIDGPGKWHFTNGQGVFDTGGGFWPWGSLEYNDDLQRAVDAHAMFDYDGKSWTYASATPDEQSRWSDLMSGRLGVDGQRISYQWYGMGLEDNYYTKGEDRWGAWSTPLVDASPWTRTDDLRRHLVTPVYARDGLGDSSALTHFAQMPADRDVTYVNYRGGSYPKLTLDWWRDGVFGWENSRGFWCIIPSGCSHMNASISDDQRVKGMCGRFLAMRYDPADPNGSYVVIAFQTNQGFWFPDNDDGSPMRQTSLGVAKFHLKAPEPDVPQPQGTISVTKRTSGGTSARKFTGTATFTDPDGNRSTETFSLSGGDTWTSGAYPAGTTYEVSEDTSSLEEGWQLDSVTPAKGTVGVDAPTAVTISNSFHGGNLTVTKRASPGASADGTLFGVTATFTRPDGTVSTETCRIGIGESWTSATYPDGTTWKVEETDIPAGSWHEVSVTPATGTIGSGPSVVTVTNQSSGYVRLTKGMSSDW